MSAGSSRRSREGSQGTARRHIPLWCADCGHIFRPRPADGPPRCTRCGSARCQPVRRVVGGTTRPAGSPVEEDRFARVALWGSLITSEQFAECVEEQKRRAAAGDEVPSLPQLLIDRGHLRPRHAHAVFRVMTTRSSEQWRNQFGQVALRKGFVSEEQLRECLEEQTRLVMSTGSAPILGHLLLERGYMTEARVLAILRVQAHRQLGALHDLEAALRPGRARAAAFLGRHRRALALCALALGLAAAAALGAWAHAVVAAPTTYDLVCDHCGYRARLPADAFVEPCTRCGKGQMLTPLHCAACGADFPLRVHTAPDGAHWIEPCPRCGSLGRVRLPKALERFRAARPPTDRGARRADGERGRGMRHERDRR